MGLREDAHEVLLGLIVAALLWAWDRAKALLRRKPRHIVMPLTGISISTSVGTMTPTVTQDEPPPAPPSGNRRHHRKLVRKRRRRAMNTTITPPPGELQLVGFAPTVTQSGGGTVAMNQPSPLPQFVNNTQWQQWDAYRRQHDLQARFAQPSGMQGFPPSQI